MLTIIGKAQPDGGIDMSDYSRDSMRRFIKENAGSRIRLKIDRETPESSKQRKYLHGAVISLWAYLDGQDWRSSALLDHMYELAKIEFNGEWLTVSGKAHRVGMSTKGKLNEGFIEKVIDFLEEQYGIDREEVLNPEEYKHWRDVIYPAGGPETYIEYLESLNRL